MHAGPSTVNEIRGQDGRQSWDAVETALGGPAGYLVNVTAYLF